MNIPAYKTVPITNRPLRNTPADPVRRHRPDYWRLILCIALLGIGMVVVYAISPALGAAQNVDSGYFVSRQAIAIAVGAVAFLLASRLPLEFWRRITLPLLALAALATLLALILPVDPRYPAQRWIRLGGFSFQSVELLKFAFLVWLAGFLAARADGGMIADAKRTLKPLVIALLALGFVVAGIQSDLGSMAVIVAMMGIVAFVAGLPMRRLLLVGGVVLILGFAFIASTPYRRERLATFVNPAADCQNSGYQACQALISIGSGGMFGLGLGRSVQAYGYLPEAANDSIFAIYAEKFGFAGVAVLLALLAAFFGRLKSLAERASDSFSRLFIAGVLSWLAVQAIINIGAMLGMLPLKGITLPLVSYGGTSLVFVMLALGMVFNMSRYSTYATAEVRQPAGGRSLNRHSLERRRNV
jgi:cell division protein FtsW